MAGPGALRAPEARGICIGFLLGSRPPLYRKRAAPQAGTPHDHAGRSWPHASRGRSSARRRPPLWAPLPRPPKAWLAWRLQLLGPPRAPPPQVGLDHLRPARCGRCPNPQQARAAQGRLGDHGWHSMRSRDSWRLRPRQATAAGATRFALPPRRGRLVAPTRPRGLFALSDRAWLWPAAAPAALPLPTLFRGCLRRLPFPCCGLLRCLDLRGFLSMEVRCCGVGRFLQGHGSCATGCRVASGLGANVRPNWPTKPGDPHFKGHKRANRGNPNTKEHRTRPRRPTARP